MEEDDVSVKKAGSGVWKPGERWLTASQLLRFNVSARDQAAAGSRQERQSLTCIQHGSGP